MTFKLDSAIDSIREATEQQLKPLANLAVGNSLQDALKGVDNITKNINAMGIFLYSNYITEEHTFLYAFFLT